MVQLGDGGEAKAIRFANLLQNEITVTDEAMELLGSFPCDQKLSIVTFVGPCNSGKSTLASKLVGAQNQGFPVRPPSIEPPSAETLKTSHTNGIMVWNKPIKLKDGALMIVLDMQGLPPPTVASQTTTSLRSPRTSALRSPRGALQRGNPTDRLLAFATLISSLVVYTQSGTISLQDTLAECLDPIAKFSDQIQKEIGAELGQSASILSTSSAGNMSNRSFNGGMSVLDITTTVASDLKDIVCQSMLCVVKDFAPSQAQVTEGITQRKAAKLAFEQAFSPCQGVTNETIRKNKTIECVKTIFPHRAVLSLSPPSDSGEQSKDIGRLLAAIKRKAMHKVVCGKALNANMLLALSLEYAETLSMPVQSSSLTLPGVKTSGMGSLILLFQAFSRVSEEETMRISDSVLAEFEIELNELVNEQTMPLSDKSLGKIQKNLEEKARAKLRKDMAEIATFEEVMFETDKIEDKIRSHFEIKRQQNYSQSYYFAVGLLKQLYEQEFQNVDITALNAAELKDKWLNLTNEFKFNSGEDNQAKYDVFAECLIRMPLEDQARFVDYSKVECERATDLADETDTLDQPNDGNGRSGVPQDLLSSQIQIMTLFESHVEQMKQNFVTKLTESQVEAQKVFQNQKQLDQAKHDNEAQMEHLKTQSDSLVQKRNDMQLKVQAVDREREEIASEYESMAHVTGQEQQKHKAQIEKQSGVAEEELSEYRRQAEEHRAQLAQLDTQLMMEESEYRSEVQLLECGIQASKDEQDQMDQALAQKDRSAVIQQVNQFFGHEVPQEYLGKIKEVFGNNAQEAKQLKLQLFEEQRKLNDVDYKFTQEQLQLKQKVDEEFKCGRQRKEKELQESQARYDSIRQRHLELSQKKESTNYQLQSAMSLLEERQEAIITLSEAKEMLQKKIDEDVSKIVEMKASLTEGGEGMEALEHQIYELSIQNRNQLALKEKLIELISEMVKSSQRGKPTPEMAVILQSLPDDRLKHRLETILHPKTGNLN